MKKQSIFITSLFIALLITSCNWFTSPEELEPGRRDYVWTADTLVLEMSDFQSIWGSSPADVWVGTFRNGENFHYDGETWIEHNEIGTSGYALYGFSEDDVWIGGDDGRIWHYDGSKWEEHFRYVDPKFRFATIRDFIGLNSNDIYAVGVTFCEGDYNEWTHDQRAFILHYNGYQWEERFFADFQSQFTRIEKSSEKYFILNVTVDNMHGDTTSVFLFNRSNSTLVKILYETTIENINIINEQLYIIMNNQIYLYTDNKLIELNTPSILDTIHQIYGRHKNDLLIRTRNSIIHYNGTDIKNLYSFDNEWTYSAGGAIIFEKEIFFCCSDYINNKFFILKGKLD